MVQAAPAYTAVTRLTFSVICGRLMPTPHILRPGENPEPCRTLPATRHALRTALQIHLAAVGHDTAEVRRQLDHTAQRIVAKTEPEPPHLRFHELRLPALVEQLKRDASGCERVTVQGCCRRESDARGVALFSACVDLNRARRRCRRCK